MTNFLAWISKTGLGDRNLTMIRDPYQQNYARGVSPEIPDLISLVEWHRRRLKELPYVTEVYNIGVSSGGYGALLFGHLLGARRVWAFGPRTARLNTADAAKAILKELLAEGRGATEYFIHYAVSNRRDRAFAEYFAQSPGVVLAPYEGPCGGTWNHVLAMQALMDTGNLWRILPSFAPAATPGHPAISETVMPEG